MVDCEKPDLLLAYIGGAAGRFLAHMVMLSPELHTWNNEVEQLINGNPESATDFKLSYMLTQVFPGKLKQVPMDWKKHEPAPWQASYEKSRLFIRFAWMRETLAKIHYYNAKKIAYVDYGGCLYFTLKASIEKGAGGMVDCHNGLGLWHESDIEIDRISKVKLQLDAAEKTLAQWAKYGFYKINLVKILTDDVGWIDEYLSLCNYYEITADVDSADELRNQWLSCHDGKLNPTSDEIKKSELKFYDVAYLEYLSEKSSIS
jgi:hypothetical protein